MTTSWSYDLAKNTISAEFDRVFNVDIFSDVRWTKELETDNTVIKPAIKG